MWLGMGSGRSYGFRMWSGNRFDVPGVVKFRHVETGIERRTEIYCVGHLSWYWRFTGMLPGLWTYDVETELPGWDGDRGLINVTPRSNPLRTGFLTHVGNKYAIQQRDETDLHGYLFNVYMGRVKHPVFLEEYGANLEAVADKALAYLEDARANGFEVIFIHVNNNWFKFGARRHDEHDSINPDLLTFDVLETIITTVHDNGGRVHIWAWGDESRKWTPKGLPGGINGEADRRLQRYIAARLGPLPGWTMGYGFDLHEWTNQAELNAWATYLHEHMGWQHLLCARGYRLQGPHNINSYDGFGRNVPLATTAHGPADYEEIVEDLNSDLTKPHLYEERHSYRREGFDLDMDGTRRLLWWEAMAGGMGGFFGFYPNSPYPYPNPEQLRAHYDFWHKGGRFVLDMQRANDFVVDGYALWSPTAESGVLYKEDAGRFSAELPGVADPQPIVACDARRGPTVGQETVVMALSSGEPLSFVRPRCSDWALAAGQFEHGSRSSLRDFWGLITVDSVHPQWLAHADGKPFFMCGPGDPEGFLYRGSSNADGTRAGDQMQLIEKLKGTGANCIYLMAVRSHGGDGDRTHNPFIDHDPSQGLNAKVLDQWEQWFAEMDRYGIVIYLFIYDDSALVWKTGDEVGPQEREFLDTLVNRFEHHDHLIWCIAEEYAERLSANRVRRLAAVIKAADDFDHPVAVHLNHGLDFSEFADDPSIDQFAIQYNVSTAEELHAGVVQAWRQARGRYSLNLSEAADWGSGAEARKKAWACAMGGACVMVLGMDIASTPDSDLIDCGHLVSFFESVNLLAMEPHDELAHGDTQYVLAKPGQRYVVYAASGTGRLGVRRMKAGDYAFRWFDCATGNATRQELMTVGQGDQAWEKPNDFGPEVAVCISRLGN